MMQKIQLDRFPCDIMILDQTGEFDDFEGARVILTENRFLVAIDDEYDAKVIFYEEYENLDISSNSEKISVINAKDGKTVTFKENRTCGCGSRLRGWNPYKTLERLEG